MLALRDISVCYQGVPVVSGVDLDLAPGTLTALVGPNGAGKSTLLKAIFGEVAPSRGTVTCAGAALPNGRRRREWQSRIGFMIQDTSAEPGLSVLETVLLGATDRLGLRVSDTVMRAAATALATLDLAELAGRCLDTLSGGQRQLVFFAQMLIREPRILLLDEPVSTLDLRHQLLLMEKVRRLTGQRDLVTLAVLHDLNLAARFADRVVLMAGGRVVATGRPEDVLTADRVGAVYGVEAEIRPDADGRPWIRVRAAAPPASGVFAI